MIPPPAESPTKPEKRHDAGLPLLILDNDETLVHSAETELAWPHHFQVGPFRFHVRPFVSSFLEAVMPHFQVAVWTSSSLDYATAVLQLACPGVEFAFVWARERCTRRFDPENQEHFWVKDLKKVKRLGHDLRRTLMVDDTPKKLSRNYGNLIRVAPFEGDPRDDELLALAGYLAGIREVPDLRAIEKRGWRRRPWASE